MAKGNRFVPGYMKDEKVTLNEAMGDFEAPEPPSWLHPLAKEEWSRVVPELTKFKLLSHLDVNLIAAYCQTFAQWREIDDQVMREGHVINVSTPSGVVPRKNPATEVAQNLVKTLITFSEKLGLSPRSRNVIKTKKPQSKEEDDFDDFVDHGGYAQHDQGKE